MIAAGRGGARVPGTAWAVAAWTPDLPLGLQYLAFLGATAWALSLMARHGALASLRRQPLWLAAAALWGWLMVSLLWSTASPADQLAAMWSYTLPLAVVPLAWACPPEAARRALSHFVVASSVVGLLFLLSGGGSYGAGPAWRPVVDVTGNQRIAFSLLLALGAALAVLQALQAGARGERAAWIVATLLCLGGLALQDRRTGMIAAPLLLAALAWMRLPGTRQRLLMVAAAVVAAAVAWWATPNIQQRFDEGLAELRAYPADGDVASSWGTRARMAELTWQMMGERPLNGFGVGSWPGQWAQRVGGSPGLAGHSTPHSELLLLGAQGGLPALLALAALAGVAFVGIRRLGPSGHAAALVGLALAWGGCVAAVLRDTKFALPLLLLAALAWAAAGGPARRGPDQPDAGR